MSILMKILSNFDSIYCFIAFVFGAMFILTTLSIVAMRKSKEPRNKVHFYVARDMNNSIWLYLGKPYRDANRFHECNKGSVIARQEYFSVFELNEKDFENLKFEDEPVEVLLNLKD